MKRAEQQVVEAVEKFRVWLDAWPHYEFNDAVVEGAKSVLADRDNLLKEVERLKRDLYGDETFPGHLALTATVNEQLAEARRGWDSCKSTCDTLRDAYYKEMSRAERYAREAGVSDARLQAALAAKEAAEATVAEMREALTGFDDEFMTSEHHHPDHVLIPTSVFERVRALSSNKTREQR